tara:strand:+ start:332 stop:2089 length:1758 start_codon:yes stop_codon:yes gene_type:complete
MGKDERDNRDDVVSEIGDTPQTDATPPPADAGRGMRRREAPKRPKSPDTVMGKDLNQALAEDQLESATSKMLAAAGFRDDEEELSFDDSTAFGEVSDEDYEAMEEQWQELFQEPKPESWSSWVADKVVSMPVLSAIIKALVMGTVCGILSFTVTRAHAGVGAACLAFVGTFFAVIINQHFGVIEYFLPGERVNRIIDMLDGILTRVPLLKYMSTVLKMIGFAVRTYGQWAAWSVSAAFLLPAMSSRVPGIGGMGVKTALTATGFGLSAAEVMFGSKFARLLSPIFEHLQTYFGSHQLGLLYRVVTGDFPDRWAVGSQIGSMIVASALSSFCKSDDVTGRQDFVCNSLRTILGIPGVYAAVEQLRETYNVATSTEWSTLSTAEKFQKLNCLPAEWHLRGWKGGGLMGGDVVQKKIDAAGLSGDLSGAPPTIASTQQKLDTAEERLASATDKLHASKGRLASELKTYKEGVETDLANSPGEPDATAGAALAEAGRQPLDGDGVGQAGEGEERPDRAARLAARLRKLVGRPSSLADKRKDLRRAVEDTRNATRDVEAATKDAEVIRELMARLQKGHKPPETARDLLLQ